MVCANFAHTTIISFSSIYSPHKITTFPRILQIIRRISSAITQNHKITLSYNLKNTLHIAAIGADMNFKSPPKNRESSTNNTGEDFSEVIDLLKECSDFGLTLILFTTQENQSEIDWRIKYCEDLGLKVSYVNESPVMTSSKKPYFNILLDDRAGLDSTFYQLFDALQIIKKF